ncbi:ABC transporter permease [Nocardioides sp. B-3]|uniref:ABC transporter permease n=1 Tax=Nocardioides sp. B-3 TaxID=2895565 RepID=UPI00300E2733
MTLFAAAQAPVLVSRDLRHRSIVLYLARPLSPTMFALVRWASLSTAILAFTLLPTIILYGGGLLAGPDAGLQTPIFVRSVALQVLLAAVLAGITGLISSVALRRGFAVVASIVVLIAVTGVMRVIREIAYYEHIDDVGEVAGLVSPGPCTTGWRWPGRPGVARGSSWRALGRSPTSQWHWSSRASVSLSSSAAS